MLLELKDSRLEILKGFNTFVETLFKWAHLGLNQGPPDYESGALTS